MIRRVRLARIVTNLLSTQEVVALTAVVTSSGVRAFNMKQHEMEKRRKRELERAGIKEDDDDAPWVAPEEQQRLDEEAEQRKAEQAVLMKKIMEERAVLDAEKKAKLKEFRAKQLAMSKRRKEASAEAKLAGASSRVIDDGSHDEEPEVLKPISDQPRP